MDKPTEKQMLDAAIAAAHAVGEFGPDYSKAKLIVVVELRTWSGELVASSSCMV